LRRKPKPEQNRECVEHRVEHMQRLDYARKALWHHNPQGGAQLLGQTSSLGHRASHDNRHLYMSISPTAIKDCKFGRTKPNAEDTPYLTALPKSPGSGKMAL
jgi:hypothetical protein